MPIEVKDNANIAGLVKEVEKAFNRALRTEAPKMVVGIRARTKSGADYQNNSFANYSNSYAAAKAKALGTANPVNLTSSGEMLNGLRHKILSPLEAQISVEGADAKNKARWNQGEGNAPARTFLGLDSKQIQAFKKAFINLLRF